MAVVPRNAHAAVTANISLLLKERVMQIDLGLTGQITIARMPIGISSVTPRQE